TAAVVLAACANGAISELHDERLSPIMFSVPRTGFQYDASAVFPRRLAPNSDAMTGDEVIQIKRRTIVVTGLMFLWLGSQRGKLLKQIERNDFKILGLG